MSKCKCGHSHECRTPTRIAFEKLRDEIYRLKETYEKEKDELFIKLDKLRRSCKHENTKLLEPKMAPKVVCVDCEWKEIKYPATCDHWPKCETYKECYDSKYNSH